jgi:alpha-galactosidase/6-phospho-beta-glucosidase family protein
MKPKYGIFGQPLILKWIRDRKESQHKPSKMKSTHTSDTNEHRYRRGDLNPAGTHRFWGYQKQLLKKTGKQGERWIPANRFEEYRKQAMICQVIATANTEFRKMQKNKLQTA